MLCYMNASTIAKNI